MGAGPEEASLSKYLRTDLKEMKDWAMGLCEGRAFPAEETVSAKALRLDRAWHV